MTVRPPTREMLQKLAELNHFSLSGRELEDFHEIIYDLFDGFHKLEQMPSNLPTTMPGSVGPVTGRRPRRTPTTPSCADAG